MLPRNGAFNLLDATENRGQMFPIGARLFPSRIRARLNTRLILIAKSRMRTINRYARSQNGARAQNAEVPRNFDISYDSITITIL